MFVASRSQLLGAWLLLLCFCFDIAVAKRGLRLNRVHKRDSLSALTSTSSESSSPTTSTASQTGGDEGNESESGTTTTGTLPVSTNSSLMTPSTSSTASTSALSAATSNIVGALQTSSAENTDQYFNSTLTPDKLPLTPKVTPGYGVAGAILLLTGLVYTTIGIKQNRFQIYMSAAYLASLATTVLIIYVMSVPITSAVQGAHVIAVVMSGLIIGVAAMFFKELTEGLGCLLGGFCLSMWLLTLRKGGLLHSVSEKSVFIAVFTVAGFSTSFSHYTRPYGLIVLISFAGATAVVLGIDCFSRAGLKEFWAWIWHVNGDLFPLGATTYPLTRGMKVESAAIIVFFLAGLISQSKLWKIVKERQEQHAKERLEDERTNQEVEENVGRRVEHHAAKERGQWEAVYGDKDTINTAVDSIQDSGFCDSESQRRRVSATTSVRKGGVDQFEMAGMSPTTPTSPTLPIEVGLCVPRKSKDDSIKTGDVDLGKDGSCGVPDEMPVGSDQRLSSISKHASIRNQTDEPVWVVGTDGEARLDRRHAQQNSGRRSLRGSVRKSQNLSRTPSGVDKLPSPEVPDIEVEEDAHSRAACVTDKETATIFDTKRLSAGSAMLMRGLSKKSKRSSRQLSVPEDADGVEDLVDDKASSVAAMWDEHCDDDDWRSRRSSLRSLREEAGERSLGEEHGSRRLSTATIETGILGPSDQATIDGKIQQRPGIELEPQDKQTNHEPSEAIKDVEASSPIAPITLSTLPSRLPKVAQNFRTNEWAKHVNATDIPPQEASLAHPSTSHPHAENADIETPAPVDVAALGQSALDTIPRASRSSAQYSSYLRPNSQLQSRSTLPYLPNVRQSTFTRTPSQQSLVRPPSLDQRHHVTRSSSTPQLQSQTQTPYAFVETSLESSPSPSPQPRTSVTQLTAFPGPTTLLGQRDTILRNKQCIYGNLGLTKSPVQGHTPEMMGARSTNRMSSLNDYRYSAQIKNNIPEHDEEGDDVPLSARRNMLKERQLQERNFYAQQQQPHQRRSDTPQMVKERKEAQLRSFRESVQSDLKREGDGRNLERISALGFGGGSGVAMGGIGNGQVVVDRHREAMRKLQARAG